MCVECLIGKQKKPILFKVTEPSSIPYRTHSACAKRAAYPDPPPVIPLPESISPPKSYPSPPKRSTNCSTRALSIVPGSAPARNVSRYWGSPRACYRIPCVTVTAVKYRVGITGGVLVCVECFKVNWKTKETNSLLGHRAEFHTVQNSSRVRQKGGEPGPPTRNPAPRIHRRPSGLPTDLQEH